MSDMQPPVEGPPGDDNGNESEQEPPELPQPDPPRGDWTGRIMFAVGPDGQHVAYRPGEVLTTRGDEALSITNALHNHEDVYIAETVGPFARLAGAPDPILLVEELRLSGIKAQPNYVYFSHGSKGGPGHHTNPVHPSAPGGALAHADPVHPSPVHPSPVHPSPVHPSPVHPSPVHPSMYGSAAFLSPFDPDPFAQIPSPESPFRYSTCLPAPPEAETQPLFDRIKTPAAPHSPHVIVLDTGLAAAAFLPDALQGGAIKAAMVPRDTDGPDEDGNHFLDPTAGHGTFIAGVIAQIAPGCRITLHRVLSTFGDGAEWDIVMRLLQLLTTLPQPHNTLINLSFGGYVLDDPHAMAWAIRALQAKGVTVVASAGNDASWQPQFPAALPGVIAVGATGPTGAAWFTNYGPWVDACAPGVYLLSTFFTGWNGDAPKGIDGLDPDEYVGWAQWSGTSFSAPVVVGNLARLMMLGDTAPAAIRRLITAPALTRLPYLGTVVDAM